MRDAFEIIYLLLITALGVCIVMSRRSAKSIGRSVALLVGALLPPVIGNLIIISSSDRLVSTVGYYIYFLGMNFVMFALLKFTFDYCLISRPDKRILTAVYALLGIDAAQLLCNPIFGHAFGTEPLMVDGQVYYRLLPYLGQTFHRVADYGIFAAVLIIFFVKMVRTPRIYSERYSVILLAMVFTGIWETFYIFSRTPVDRSMIGFAVFGLLVFFFSLYYRPVRLLDSMLANMASEMPEALFFFDATGRCIWANPTGRQLAAIEGQDFDPAMARLTGMFGDLGAQADGWSSQRTLGDDANTARYYALERHTVTDRKGRLAGSFLSIRDNTEAQRSMQQEMRAAHHDRLTGLYNRDHLYSRVRETLDAHPDEDYLIVFVDVLDFKLVNDIFGHDFGDYALQRIADLIREGVTEDAVYGRLGGDTFGICMPAGQFDAARAESQLSSFIVADSSVEHHVLIHLGVYAVTEPELDISVMFDRARMALSTIKEDYNIYVAHYSDEMRSKALWNQQISHQLPEALAQRQIRPYLQPMVDSTGSVVGAEALVRWIHPTLGFLSPAAFIPVFEKNGMIAEVDKHMWRCACEILARWQREGRDMFISVNISPKDFYFMDVASEIRAIVREFDIDPARLRIEITETVMMTDIDNRIRLLNELKQEGFLVEMDDFGSGYSSLNMLKDMPVDVIKIDMMFLNQSRSGNKANTILHNIIHLSDDLGISSVTEGVETQTQYQMLTDMGCKLFQGYYFAKPMPVEEFERFCRRSA